MSDDELRQSGFIRLADVLRRLPVSASTVWRWVKAGRFPAPLRLSARVTVWRASEIEAWLETGGAGMKKPATGAAVAGQGDGLK